MIRTWGSGYRSKNATHCAMLPPPILTILSSSAKNIEKGYEDPRHKEKLPRYELDAKQNCLSCFSPEVYQNLTHYTT